MAKRVKRQVYPKIACRFFWASGSVLGLALPYGCTVTAARPAVHALEQESMYRYGETGRWLPAKMTCTLQY